MYQEGKLCPKFHVLHILHFWQSATLAHQILSVCLSVELIEHIGIYKNPQAKYVKPQCSYLFTGFVYNYWLILYCAWVLTLTLFYFIVGVFNVSLWCSGWFLYSTGQTCTVLPQEGTTCELPLVRINVTW